MEQSGLEAMVKEALELSRENNAILKKMQRNARIRFWVTLIFWIVIIVGSAYFTYVLANQLVGMLSGGSGSGVDIQDLIRQYQQSQP